MNIADIEDFYQQNKDSLPRTIRLSPAVVITDVPAFFESHLLIVKEPHGSRPAYQAFHHRLEQVYDQLSKERAA